MKKIIKLILVTIIILFLVSVISILMFFIALIFWDRKYLQYAYDIIEDVAKESNF